MSETQYEEPVYVVNKQRRESEAVVHMPDCEKMHHQVEQDVRPEVYRETRVPAYIRFVANYSRVRPAAGRFGKALHHGDEISGAA